MTFVLHPDDDPSRWGEWKNRFKAAYPDSVWASDMLTCLKDDEDSGGSLNPHTFPGLWASGTHIYFVPGIAVPSN